MPKKFQQITAARIEDCGIVVEQLHVVSDWAAKGDIVDDESSRRRRHSFRIECCIRYYALRATRANATVVMASATSFEDGVLLSRTLVLGEFPRKVGHGGEELGFEP